MTFKKCRCARGFFIRSNGLKTEVEISILFIHRTLLSICFRASPSQCTSIEVLILTAMPAEASSSAQSAFHPSLPHRTTAEKSSQKSEPSAPASSRHPNGTSKQKTRDAILNPGTIKINVQGAFIVDDDAPTPCRVASRSPDGAASNTNGSTSRVNGERDEYFTYQHDTSDIRLPNHTAIVSHIAVDVSIFRKSPEFLQFQPHLVQAQTQMSKDVFADSCSLSRLVAR